MKKNIGGIITALATPFVNGKLDQESFISLVDDQMAKGVDGFVINGTTGESPCLSSTEVAELSKLTMAKTKNNLPLIVGTGSNSTEKTIRDSIDAEKMGADCLLVVVPYYNKPPQRGLYEHFKAVANAVSIPVILYNVPSRTITSLEVETIARLAEIKNIIGIKEASGKISMVNELKECCGNDFVLLSGDDGTFVEFLQAGGHGVISVSSHIIPRQMKNWQKLLAEGKFDVAYEDFKKYLPCINMLFCEANPIPLKKALSFMGIFKSCELRLPLVELHEKFSEQLYSEMTKVGLL